MGVGKVLPTLPRPQ